MKTSRTTNICAASETRLPRDGTRLSLTTHAVSRASSGYRTRTHPRNRITFAALIEERAEVKGDKPGQSGSIPYDVQTCLSVIISAGEILESYFERLTPQQRRLALEDILGAARRMDDWM